MTNATHYFKPEWNREYHCAQCGEYITADRHIRAPRQSLLQRVRGDKTEADARGAK
jgi:hypothetical protein